MLELVYGVLRRRLELDWRLDHVADRRMERLPAPVASVLRLAAYQVLRLTKIPHSAAVHEAVALVRRRLRSPHWPRYVNAVLRALLRTLPPTLPSICEDPVRHLSILYSCPPWLVARWVDRLGVAAAEQACRQTCEEPPLTLRVNTAKLTRKAMQDALNAAGVATSLTTVSPVGIQVEKCGRPMQLPHYVEGGFAVEDEAAQLIPMILSPRPGERVLDACAAPGGKALHCAELMGGRGEVVAVDRSEPRIRLLRENIERLGATHVHPVCFDWVESEGVDPARLPGPLRLPFDRILLDAPCSAIGILRRHPEGKWQKQPEDLLAHQARQRRLLEAVSRLLRPGGVIVYSTCSTEPEETLQVLDHFCEAHPEFVRESVAPWLPPAALPFVTGRGEFCSVPTGQETGSKPGHGPRSADGMDAFFAARLKRVDA